MDKSVENRTALVDAKAVELQEMLTEWALQNGILKVGERLAFSLWITSTPIVKHESPTTMEDMLVSEFFSFDRLIQLGVPKSSATHIQQCLINVGWWHPYKDGRRTMGEFVLYYGKSSVSVLGKKSLERVRHLLNQAGFQLSGKWPR